MHDLGSVLRSLWGVVEDLSPHGIRAFAVFGSAARGVDFIPCRSDVDVLVVAPSGAGLLRRLEIPELGPRISIALYTPEELEKLLSSGHPLLLHLYKASIVYLDDGVLSSLLSRVPSSIPQGTVRVEELSTAAALALGLEKLVLGMPEEAVDHLHHALRHLARALVGEGSPTTLFPAYDVEVEMVLGKRSSALAALLREVRGARARCRVGEDEAANLLARTWDAAAQNLGVEIPRLNRVVELCGGGRIRDVEVPLFVHREGRGIAVRCGSTVVKP